MHATSAAARAFVAVLVIAAGASIAGVGSPAAAAPRCFGAAARDPVHPCLNTAKTVTALDDPDRPAHVPCRAQDDAQLQVCAFGASRASARATFALVGDSHAAQWLPALAVVARARHWRGLLVTTSGCYFSAAVTRFLPGAREGCTRWYRSALGWFGHHPEVGTAFVAQRTTTPITVKPGETSLALKAAGFRRTWEALPPTVTHVLAIRDVPESSNPQFNCLAGVVAAGLAPGPTCVLPRQSVLKADPAVAAVRSLHARRYRTIDLTPYFCSRRSCFAVVGGVLVHRDIDHITAAYSRSLGPYLLRAVRRLVA
ncbi:MAG TPA: SGNH hydrolase domain-containing protein [Solirubrobacteraceae bacterium]|nr:SGNH hydrolase domain-containing protein [Solirubrobacteraceae bacterium]